MSLQMLRRFIVRGSNFPHVCGIRGCATSVDNNSNSAEDVKTKLLEAALLHVPKLGWSEKSIIEGQPHLIPLLPVPLHTSAFDKVIKCYNPMIQIFNPWSLLTSQPSGVSSAIIITINPLSFVINLQLNELTSLSLVLSACEAGLP